MSTFKIREISEIALLAAFIAVSGAFKLPSFIPGSEFQLSAPIAVAICGVFGIKKYLLAGILASAGGLLLGTQTIFNVLIAMLFRIVVALLYAVLGKPKSSTCYQDLSLPPQHVLHSVFLLVRQSILCWQQLFLE